MKKMKALLIIIISSVVLGICGAGIKGVLDHREDLFPSEEVSTEQTADKDAELTVDVPNAVKVVDMEPKATIVSTSDVSGVVNQAMPSVVSVVSTMETTTYSFFGGVQTQRSKGAGTGFIISQNKTSLFIATNFHVIEDSVEVNVTFADGTEADADVVGFDEEYDLAVISVPFEGLSDDTLALIRVAAIGDSEELDEGSMVVVIGNALGYGQSTTVGYISAFDREVEIDGYTREYIQTDAAINPGNSGGPMINLYGQVVGINSAKINSSQVSGICYAIPISKAVPIINELIDYSVIAENELGYLGIVGKDVSESYAAGFGLPLGIYVYDINDDSPAKDTELCVGDIIVGINDRSVHTMEELENRLSHMKAGQEIELELKSQYAGRYVDKKVTVVLANRPE